MFVYLKVLSVLGFVIASFVLCIIIMLLMGSRNWKQNILVSVILTMSVYCLFKLGLNLRLPTGLFFF